MKRGRLVAVIVLGILFIGLATDWVRSYWATDYVYWNGSESSWVLASSWGHAWIYRLENKALRGTPPGFSHKSSRPPYRWSSIGANYQLAFSFGGLRWTRQPSGGSEGSAFWFLGWPLWVMVAPIAALLAYLLRGIRVPKPGCCRKCGYDLRASPERCPECGTAVQAMGSAATG